MKHFTVLILILFTSVHALADLSAKDLMKSMTEIYSQVAFMKSDYKKTEESMLLGSKETTKGKLYYSKRKFRVEQKTKPKTIFIKGKNKFWNIQGDEVTSGQVNKAVPSVFELMFSDSKVWERFDIKYTSALGKYAEVTIDLKKKIPNIRTLKVKIHRKDRRFEEVIYTDDLKNKVSIAFSGTRFKNKTEDWHFVYKK